MWHPTIGQSLKSEDFLLPHNKASNLFLFFSKLTLHLSLSLHLAIEVMYQSSSSTSSSSQRSSLPGGGGLIRYGSAPGSLLNSMVDEVIGGSNARDFTGAVNYPPQDNFLGHFFTGADSSSLRSDSTTCGVNSSDEQKQNKDLLLDRPYGGFNEISQHKNNDVGAGGGNSSGSYSLARQRSSPADFFSYLSGEKNSTSF